MDSLTINWPKSTPPSSQTTEMNFNDFSKFEMTSRLWQGVASLYAICLIIALFGFIGLMDGDILEGLLIITAAGASSVIIHKLVKNYLKGRKY